MEKILDKLSIYNMWMFTEVIKAGSVHAAAKALDLPYMSVSYDMRLLEKTLNTALFATSSKRLVLTEKGKMLSDFSQKMLCEFYESRLIEKERPPEKEQTEITLATTHGLCDFYMLDICEKINEELPNVKLKLLAGREYMNFLTSPCDIVIGPKELNSPYLSQIFLKEFTYFWYAKNTYIKKYGKPETLKDLESHKLLIFDLNYSEYPKEMSFKNVILESSSYKSLMNSANRGLGIIPIANEFLLYFTESASEFISLFPNDPCEVERFYFAHRKHDKNLDIIRHIRDICINFFTRKDESHEVTPRQKKLRRSSKSTDFQEKIAS